MAVWLQVLWQLESQRANARSTGVRRGEEGLRSSGPLASRVAEVPLHQEADTGHLRLSILWPRRPRLQHQVRGPPALV